ncbi:pentapeptide repeat-containing protein [Algibacter pacificus]
MELKYVQFSNTKLIHADFSESDLSKSSFEGCDLQGATFENTNLEKADFRKAINYAIHPGKNKLKGAKFSLDGVAGLLTVYGVDIDAV